MGVAWCTQVKVRVKTLFKLKQTQMNKKSNSAGLNSGSPSSMLNAEVKGSGLKVTNPVNWCNVHLKREAGSAVLCLYCTASTD